MADVLRELGAQVRGLRKARALTQAELAEKANLHVTYISDIERGAARNVSVITLHAIATALQTSLAALFSLPEEDEEFYAGLAECLGKLQSQEKNKQVFVLAMMKHLVEEIDRI